MCAAPVTAASEELLAAHVAAASEELLAAPVAAAPVAAAPCQCPVTRTTEYAHARPAWLGPRTCPRRSRRGQWARRKRLGPRPRSFEVLQEPSTENIVSSLHMKQNSINQNCKITRLGDTYTGMVSITVQGWTCQHWASQFPIKHDIGSKDEEFPDGSVQDARNFLF